jgi:hypothetical protein
MSKRPKLLRYAAKLLFQFRVIVNGDSGKRRLCEERIVVLEANPAKAALKKAKAKGKSGEHSYKNTDGNKVRFEFIGVMELLELDPACRDDEVWYDIVERVSPSERRDKLIPPEAQLNAIYNERRSQGKE